MESFRVIEISDPAKDRNKQELSRETEDSSNNVDDYRDFQVLFITLFSIIHEACGYPVYTHLV